MFTSGKIICNAVIKGFFCLLFSLIPFAGLNAQLKLEWIGIANFDTIDYTGKKQKIIQRCSPSIDSVIVDGEVIFDKANIHGLGLVKYSRFLKDTIITKIQLNNRRKKGYQALKKYFQGICEGKFICNLIDGNEVLIGIKDFYSKRAIVTLFTNSGNKKNILTMELLE